MSKLKLIGKVQTVLGLISPLELGVTLTHEHLICDLTCNFTEPAEEIDRVLAYRPVTPDILWWLHYREHQNLDDLRLLDEQLAIREATHFKLAGGQTIVDMTTQRIGRNPWALAHISRATGLNVITGAGYYVKASHDPDMENKTEDDIAQEIAREILVGLESSQIRAGVIGEVGCSWPLAESERKSLRASALAQQMTGALINVHPGRNELAPMKIIDILVRAGADVTRTVISHVERTFTTHDQRAELAQTGCYLEYDLFGREIGCRHSLKDTRAAAGYPNDTQRIREIRELINKGHLNQILISQDICNKSNLRAFGGWGYDHIIRNVVPVMRRSGLTEAQIHTIMVGNPARLFTFV